MENCAYLDIETTGLSTLNGEITVIGVHLEDSSQNGFIQLVGDEITHSRLKDIVGNTQVLYTYNGSRFDLPFIREKLGIDLSESCQHRDLMYSCWKKNLYGGLKSVERQLGIQRKLTDIDGWVAVQLWTDYVQFNDRESLLRLLAYNREDVHNLKVLRYKLNV